jgi:PAS domain S-box-containing protein
MKAFSFSNTVPTLAESRKHLFDESSVAIHEIDREGIVRGVNRAECQLFGYAPHELIGHYIWEFVAVEHREASRDAIARKIAREQPIEVFTREFRCADGRYLWVDIHDTLIENAAGAVIGIRSGLLDVTARRKIELQIQQQHDRMKCLLRSWTRGIITADALGHIDFMNPAAEALTGWRPEDALGRSLETICPILDASGEPVDLMSCVLTEAGTLGPARRSPMIDRSGTNRDISWIASSIHTNDGVIIGAALVLEECVCG